jgi:hypothetical protein
MVEVISWRVGIAWLVWEYIRILDEHEVGAGSYEWATKNHTQGIAEL